MSRGPLLELRCEGLIMLTRSKLLKIVKGRGLL